MALRIAVGAFAALRAVLVYGEAGRLASQPLASPRVGRLRARPRPAYAASPWGWTGGTEPPLHVGIR